MRTLKVNEDWLSVIIALGIIFLIFLGAFPELPWPVFGWIK